MRPPPFQANELESQQFAPIMLSVEEGAKMIDRSAKTIHRWKQQRRIIVRAGRVSLTDLERAKAGAEARQRASQLDASRKKAGPGRWKADDPRHLRIRGLIAMGWSNPEIMADVGCSKARVSRERRRIREGVH